MRNGAVRPLCAAVRHCGITGKVPKNQSNQGKCPPNPAEKGLDFLRNIYYNNTVADISIFASEKGGENMALEVIQTVTQAEAKAKADREAAAAQARQRLADAQRAAKQTVEQTRQQAREEARQMMAQAEEKAAEATREALEQAEKDCEALKQNARERLEEAAQLIVGRVVER